MTGLTLGSIIPMQVSLGSIRMLKIAPLQNLKPVICLEDIVLQEW